MATRGQLRAVHDAVVDATGQATDVEVASALGEEARYFLRGPNLAAGAVESTGFTPLARDTTAPHHVFRFHGSNTASTPAAAVARTTPTSGRCSSTAR